MSRILIVEDEENIRGFLKITLTRNGYKVDEVDSGEKALDMVNSNKYNIVLLDRMLPGIDGLEVCKKVRHVDNTIGIIMVTAKGQDMDKIMGLEYGADDYIVKPFNPMEILLRIKALDRRISHKVKDTKSINEIVRGEFRIDLYSNKLYKNDNEVELTPKEFELMKYFMDNPNKAFSRNDLLDRIWGSNFYGDTKIIDVNIRRLRSKIEEFPDKPIYIETIWGRGYRWRDLESNEK